VLPDAPREVIRGKQKYKMKVASAPIRDAARVIRNIRQAGHFLPDRRIVAPGQSAKYAGKGIRAAYKLEEDTTPIQGVNIHCADFRKFPWPKGVKLILTDPMYSKKNLQDYEDTARIAKSILRPDGWLAVCTGVMFLPEVHDRLRKYLTYATSISVLFRGAPTVCSHCGKMSSHNMPAVARIMHDDNCQNRRYDILIYKMPEAKMGYRNCPYDAFVSGGSERKRYAMEKCVDDMQYVIDHLTRPRDMVADFFLGSGATMQAAYNLKRRFIGTEISPEAIKTAYRRKADMVLRKLG